MILDFSCAKELRAQRDNPFKGSQIDVLCLKNEELDPLLDRMSAVGITTLSDVIDCYTEAEFLRLFTVTKREREIVN